MLADADPLARRALREALIREPSVEVVAEAGDYPGAARAAEKQRPDVVLVDADLAEADLGAFVRASPESSFVVLSVYADEDEGLEVLYAGASGYLGKATDPASLPRVIRGVASGEAAISRVLTRRVLEKLRACSPLAEGIRPVRSELTRRQWEVIDLLRKDSSEPAIAEQLGISRGAVRSHVRDLLLKLGASSVEQGVEIARRLCVEAALGEPAGARPEDVSAP